MTQPNLNNFNEMLRIDPSGKVYVYGVETADPEKIGKAFLQFARFFGELQNRDKQAVKKFLDDLGFTVAEG